MSNQSNGPLSDETWIKCGTCKAAGTFSGLKTLCSPPKGKKCPHGFK